MAKCVWMLLPVPLEVRERGKSNGNQRPEVAWPGMAPAVLSTGQSAWLRVFPGHRAQSTPSVLRQCPDTVHPLLCTSLNSVYVWGQAVDPWHSCRDIMRQKQTELSECVPAGRMSITKIICHECRVALHVPKVGWPSPSPSCLAPGPSFQGG